MAITFTHLIREFQAILHKTEGDRQWFCLQPDGYLALYRRPQNCLARLWELTCRLAGSLFATWKFDSLWSHKRLHDKITVLTRQIEQTLESLPAQERTQILKQITPAFNQLWIAEAKIAARLHRTPLDLKQFPSIRDWMYVPHNTGEARFSLTNKDTRKIHFAIGPRGSAEKLKAVTLEPGQIRELRFPFPYWNNNLFLETRSDQPAYIWVKTPKSYRLAIEANGTLATEPLTKAPSPDCRLETEIVNRSASEALLELNVYDPGSKTLISRGCVKLAPKETKNLGLPKDKIPALQTYQIFHRASYVQSHPLVMNYKAGEYVCIFTPFDHLELRDRPVKVTTVDLPPQTLDRREQWMVSYPKQTTETQNSSSRGIKLQNSSTVYIEADLKIENKEHPPFRVEGIGVHSTQTIALTYDQMLAMNLPTTPFGVAMRDDEQLKFSLSIREWNPG